MGVSATNKQHMDLKQPDNRNEPWKGSCAYTWMAVLQEEPANIVIKGTAINVLNSS